jgi:hypothetical protein
VGTSDDGQARETVASTSYLGAAIGQPDPAARIPTHVFQSGEFGPTLETPPAQPSRTGLVYPYGKHANSFKPAPNPVSTKRTRLNPTPLRG